MNNTVLSEGSKKMILKESVGNNTEKSCLNVIQDQ